MTAATNLNAIRDHLNPPTDQPKGFSGICCLLCGHEDTVSVVLHDCSFACSECGDSIDLEEARKSIEAWRRVLAWVDTAGQF